MTGEPHLASSPRLSLFRTLGRSVAVLVTHAGSLIRLIWPWALAIGLLNFVLAWVTYQPQGSSSEGSALAEAGKLGGLLAIGPVLSAPTVAAWSRGLLGLGPKDRVDAAAIRRAVPVLAFTWLVGFLQIAAVLGGVLLYFGWADLKIGRFLLTWLVIWVGLVATGRLMLAIPARAAGSRYGIGEIWRLTSGNSSLALALCFLLTLAPSLGVSGAVWYFEDPQPAATTSAVMQTLDSVAGFVLGFWPITFFTLVFQHHAAPPITPPAPDQTAAVDAS